MWHPAELYSTAQVYHVLFVHSSGGDSGCFRMLTVVNDAAMSPREQVCVWMLAFISLGEIPRSGIPGSYRYIYLPFQGVTKLFSKVAASFYILTSSEWVVHSFLILL